jgi:hypothetical protein
MYWKPLDAISRLSAKVDNLQADMHNRAAVPALNTEFGPLRLVEPDFIKGAGRSHILSKDT